MLTRETGNWGRGVGEEGSIWELSVLSVQFFCKPKTALRNSLLITKKKNKLNHQCWQGRERQAQACIANGTTGAPGSPENNLSMLNPTRKGSGSEI